MKRALSCAVLAVLAVLILAEAADADGRRFIMKNQDGRRVAGLILCSDGEGNVSATVVAPTGNVICGPSPVVQVRPGVFAFNCNSHRFFFGCNDRGCFWRVGLRQGTLCPVRR